MFRFQPWEDDVMVARRLAIGVCVVVLMVAQTRGATIYEEDFSSDPGWTTDDAINLTWDSATETFHGTQVNSDGTCAYINLADIGFDSSQSWLLEFDYKINSCGWSAGLTLGLFDSSVNYYPNEITLHQGVVDAGPVVSLISADFRGAKFDDSFGR